MQGHSKGKVRINPLMSYEDVFCPNEKILEGWLDT